MQNQNKTIRQIKISIAAVLISFLAVTSGFAFVIKKNSQNAVEKDIKISALIDEVGDLKQVNDLLFQDNSKNTSRLKNIYVQLNVLNKNLKNDISSREQAINDIQTIQNDLVEALKDKEHAISSLAQKNLQLKKEIASSAYSKEILDIAVIGQNAGLTDAILLLSANPATGSISIISIPRDLYHKGRKINELFNLYGVEKLEEALSQVTGIAPDKYVIFDFSSFVSIIDSFGGVDINVEKDLIDNQYPGPDFTYRKITFKKGLHHMDGETALKYARSRKTTTDFDRSYRQQQVFLSLHQKIRGISVIDNLDKFLSVYDSVKDNLKTDISIFEALAYFENCKNYKIKSGNVISNRNYLYASVNKAGQYILLPINGSYAKMKAYISDLVNG